MRSLYVKGTPYEIGLQIGGTFKNHIKKYVSYRKESLVKEIIKEGIQINYERIYYLIKEVLSNPMINDSTFKELQGVADGADADVVDIYISIGYTDILDYAISFCCPDLNTKNYSALSHQECSTFAFVKNNKLYVGQNWDMDYVSCDNTCLFFKQYDNGKRIISLSTILGATHLGINESGTSVGTANLSSFINDSGIIFPQVIQKLLFLDDKQAAAEFIRNNKRMAGHYYYVGYSDNFCQLFETTTDCFYDYSPREENDFYFAHTNHYLYSEFKKIANDYSSSSYERIDSMRFLLQQYISSTTMDIELFMKNLGNHKYGLCRHANEETSLQTCASVLFIPSERSIYICDGTPCKEIWKQYNISETFN